MTSNENLIPINTQPPDDVQKRPCLPRVHCCFMWIPVVVLGVLFGVLGMLMFPTAVNYMIGNVQIDIEDMTISKPKEDACDLYIKGM